MVSPNHCSVGTMAPLPTSSLRSQSRASHSSLTLLLSKSVPPNPKSLEVVNQSK